MIEEFCHARTYAYACGATVSEEQLGVLKNADTFRLFIDDVVDQDQLRPRFKRLKLHLQPGDTLIIWSSECLGSNPESRYMALKWLYDQNINLQIISQPEDAGKILENLRTFLEQDFISFSQGRSPLSHLSEIEAHAAHLAVGVSSSEPSVLEQIEVVTNMVKQLRQHLKFIAQQIRIGEPQQALKRIDQLSNDF